MPTILEIQLKSPGTYTVRVRPDGDAAASGRLFAADDRTGANAAPVGNWSSAQDQDGSGEARTVPGKWIFADQLLRSEGREIPSVQPTGRGRH